MRDFLSNTKEQKTGELMMFIGKTLPFVTGYIDELDDALRHIDPEAGLSRIQKGWLGFCFWQVVLRASVSVILNKYGITEGVLVVDDSDKERSKKTKRIYKAHKLKDKSLGIKRIRSSSSAVFRKSNVLLNPPRTQVSRRS